jgi:hypothetical protein
VIRAMARVDDVKSSVTMLESFGDERHQHPILLVARVKERADVTGTIEDGSSQVNGTFSCSDGHF